MLNNFVLKKSDPIIIIGSHRSGTSLVTSVLQQLGLSIGCKLDENSESVFFQSINIWLLSQSGGAWDNPNSIKHLFANPDQQTLIKKYIKFLMKSPRASQFLGFKNYVRYRDIQKLDFCWGWKDPRNTYTLPLWLDLFPNAKVVHIYRHGVDVANSLYTRCQKTFRHSLEKYESKKWIYPIVSKRERFIESYRTLSLEGSFQIWEEYIQTAKKHVQSLDNKAIEIQYEELLLAPTEVLKNLVQFVGLTVDHSDLQKISDRFQRKRAYAFKKDERLQLFSNQMSHRLRLHGY
jgi:hypothetical protein